MDIKNICFLICGLPRSIDLVIYNIEKLFDPTIFELNYFVCTSIHKESEYCNTNELNTLIENVKIKNILLLENLIDTSYRNACNYFKKIVNGIKCIDDNYDIYFIIRSDLILENIHFLSYVTDDGLYLSNSNNNSFTINEPNRLNEQIIITKNFNLLLEFIKIYEFSIKNINYSDIIMYNFITTNKIKYNIININYKLILSKCNIIAISGDSGSGKSSLMEYLINLYDRNVLKLETDRYHKWERNNINYNSITHLNPYANHLEMMENDVFNLKIGNEIYQVDYNHDTGKFTDKNKIESSNNIILCGLHTLYMDSLNSIIDIKIYMDTNRDLITKWKIQRDTNKRGYTIDKINKQIESRKNDYYEYIYSQKINADIIVNLYENENELKCNLIIQNQYIFNKLSVYFIKYNYKINIENNCFIIELKNNYNYIASNENINYTIPNITIENNYYNEILILLILYMK